MIEFETLRIDNIALYSPGTLELDLSPDAADKQATLIRAHNEHGKTTLFRALAWAVFGTDGLRATEDMAVDTALRATNHEGDQLHRTELEFRSDSERFKLVREITSTESGDKIRLHDESVRILKHDPDHSPPWVEGPAALARTFQEFYFPPSVAPYLFLNEDKVKGVAADAASGSKENEVTAAINRMLGLDALAKAKQRLDRQADKIERQVADSVGRDDKADRLKEARDGALTAVDDEEEEFETAKEELRRVTDQLEEVQTQLDQIEAVDPKPVYDERDSAGRAVASAKADVADKARRLQDLFASKELMLPLFTSVLAPVSARLGTLHKDGVIPQAELPLLRKMLDPVTNESQQCICGETDISEGTTVRKELEQRVAESEEFESDAGRLEQLRGDIGALTANTVVAPDWFKSFKTTLSAVEGAKKELRESQIRLETAEEAVREHDKNNNNEKLTKLRDRKDNLNTQKGTLEARVDISRAKLEGGLDATGKDHGKGLRSKADSARRKYTNHLSKMQDSRPLMIAVSAADKIAEVYDSAADDVRVNQVPMISERMNEIFARITNNALEDLKRADDDEHDTARDVASGRVGVRATSAGFELFGETLGGRNRPLGLLNGASRRALTVSFMLALFEHSRAAVPMVTDSLLHALSGSVRYNLARHLLHHPGQKVLFYTHDDAASEALRDMMVEVAAHTYTLSNSIKSHELTHDPERGDTLIMVCNCGPHERCETCDLADDAEAGPSPTRPLADNSNPKRVA